MSVQTLCVLLFSSCSFLNSLLGSNSKAEEQAVAQTEIEQVEPWEETEPEIESVAEVEEFMPEQDPWSSDADLSYTLAQADVSSGMDATLYATTLTTDAGSSVATNSLMANNVIDASTTDSSVALNSNSGSSSVVSVPVSSSSVSASTSKSIQPYQSSPLSRTEKRQLKRQEYEQAMDSLIMSHQYRFVPNSMQEIPSGSLQLIYNMLYSVAVLDDHVEVHIPNIRGNVVQYIDILNFDTFDVSNYLISKSQYNWDVTFCMQRQDGEKYISHLIIYPLTGEAILNLLTSTNTVRYVGYIEGLGER